MKERGSSGICKPGSPPRHVQWDPINLARGDNSAIMRGIMGRSWVVMRRVALLSTESQSGFFCMVRSCDSPPPSSHVIRGQRERLTRCLSHQHLPARSLSHTNTHTYTRLGTRESSGVHLLESSIDRPALEAVLTFSFCVASNGSELQLPLGSSSVESDTAVETARFHVSSYSCFDSFATDPMSRIGRVTYVFISACIALT